jgi:hypothetical protein
LKPRRGRTTIAAAATIYGGWVTHYYRAVAAVLLLGKAAPSVLRWIVDKRARKVVQKCHFALCTAHFFF